MMMGGEGRGGRGKPCKFGFNCNNYKQGNCTFLHDVNAMSTGGFGNPTTGGLGGRGGRGAGFNNNLPTNYNTGGGMGGGQGSRPQQSYPPQQQQTYQPKTNIYESNPQDISQKFCRNFQLTGECKFGPKCNRLHEFTKGEILKRVMKMKDIPNNQISRLCTLNINGSTFFTLRMGNAVTIFQYNSQSGQINQLPQTFALENHDIHWYDSREKYLYFAYENKNTSFTNIGFIDLTTKQKITVDNAHKLKVTGIIHIFDNNNQPLVLSSSIDGTIKVWKVQGEKMILNQEISEAINNCFKTNTNFEVLFLNKQNISGNQVLSAGTSDNRLLFWIGSEMKFQQVVFEEPYNKVLSIKYVQTGPSWVAITIIWSADASLTALMAVNLANMQHEVLMHEQVGGNKRQLFSSIEKAGSLFLVANLTGLVTIFKIPDFKNKIGCIFHNNSLADMVSSASLTSTNIQMLNLFILQRMESGKEGSFSVYNVRE